MEKNFRRNRVALLGALLVIGLVLAGLGTALGVGGVFQFEKTFRTVVITDQVTICEDGKTVVQNFTLPEGEEYTWETSEGGIHIFTTTEEETEKRQAELEAELNKCLEIAKRDSRVQELLEGKEYNVLGTGTGIRDGEKIDRTLLVLEVEGKTYVVKIDMNSETVKSVEEHITTGPDGETISWSEGVPEGVHRPAIPER